MFRCLRSLRLLLPLAALLLGGCVKIFIVGHSEDWAEYMTGTGTADPLAGRGTAEIRLARLGAICSGSFKDYAPGKARGEVRCSDGRVIKTESWALSMSRGKGYGIDQFGHRGEFEFFTEERDYENELATVRAEVERRNLDIAHLRIDASSLAPGAATPQSVPDARFAEKQAAVIAAKKAALSARQPSVDNGTLGAPPSSAEATALPPPVVAPAVAPATPTPAAASAPTATQPAAAPAVSPVTPAPGKRLALVIGNNNYREAPLKNPVNDARALAAKLRKLGFEVLSGENMTQRDMTRLVTRFGERLGGHDVGLFFFAGHGMQVKGKNYLIPVDAQIGSESSVRTETVDVDAVLDQLSASPLNVVILDACRNNPFERRFRSVSGGLAQMEAPKGTLIAYATAPGKVALDGEGANSTYTTALLKALDEPGLAVESVFKRVRAEVARMTSDMQVPWEASSLTGDFYFAARAAETRPAAAPAIGADSDAEIVFWQSIRDSHDAEEFAAYLRQYPNGRFAEIARNRINRLKAAK